MMERTMTTERGDKRQKKNVISTNFYYHQLIDHYPPEIKDGMLFKKSFGILSLNGRGERERGEDDYYIILEVGNAGWEEEPY